MRLETSFFIFSTKILTFLLYSSKAYCTLFSWFKSWTLVRGFGILVSAFIKINFIFDLNQNSVIPSNSAKSDEQSIMLASVRYSLIYIMQHRIEGEELTYEDEPSNNSSLTINKLENAFEQNQNQIEMMEKFIKSKTSEIATLQQYLIGEFQSMENAKARNKRVEKILVAQAIPVLKDISASLRKFQDYLTPFVSVATAYITTLASKSQDILTAKQATIDQQARTIQQLQQKLNSLGRNSKEDQWQKPKGHNESKFQEISQTGKANYCIKNDSYLIDHKVHRVQKDVSAARQSLTKIAYFKEKPKEVCKSPHKVAKYEQCYQNILENKKFINYRCERPLSPLQINGDLHRKQEKSKPEFAISYERKQCIKQKIEKIKIRTECKQKQARFAFYENNH